MRKMLKIKMFVFHVKPGILILGFIDSCMLQVKY